MRSIHKIIAFAFLTIAVTGTALAQSGKSFDSLQMKGVAVVKVPVDAAAAAQRLSGGIKFPTISNQDRKDFNEKAFSDYHQYLATTYPLLHKTLKRDIVGEPRKFSLLYTWQGSDPSLDPIVLMGHLDVVPVVPGTEKQWEHDAFSGDIAGGYIWGRGSLDDKITVQGIMEAVEMQLKQGFKPKRTIYLAFGQDEEVGGPEGAGNIVAVLKSRGVNKVAFVLDEGVPITTGLFPGIKGPLALIGTAEKGFLSLQLKIEGAGGHSSMPPEHSNIGILSAAIARLEDHPFPYRITQGLRDQYRFLGPELPEAYRQMLTDVVFGGSGHEAKPAPAGASAAEPPKFGDDPTVGFANDSEKSFIRIMEGKPNTRAMLHTTTAVTIFNAGIKDNVLPPSATAVVNFRILQGETIESVIKRVKEIINDERIKVTDISASVNPSPISDPYGPEYKLMEKTIRQTWGTPDLLVSPLLVIGGNDAKWFHNSIAKNVYRLTTVRVESAADVGRLHGVNERVLVDEYAKSIGFYYQFLINAQGL
ncbi:MAG: M20 family peptidase [Deltaproteobacteria bacterium]